MENLDKALKSVGDNIVAEIRKLAKKDNFESSGDLDKSISYKVEGNIVEVSANRYIEALSGGINRKKFPNVDRIKEWIRIKGIAPRDRKGRFVAKTDANMNKLAFVIGRSIGNKGISKRFGYKGSGFLEEVKKDVVNNVTDMIAEAYKLDIIVKLKEI